MSASIVPFPLNRRRGLVMRQARRALELCPEKAERHLEVQTQVQREALIRRGVEAEMVERQAREFEAAIRAEMWRQTFSGGGAA